MLAKLTAELPAGDGWLFEPKWDGFRAIVFRAGERLYIQSRDSRPLDRYFPELVDRLLANLPPRCVVDGEIVIATRHGLDFDALQMRLPSRGVAREEAGRRDAGGVRGLRPARARAARPARPAACRNDNRRKWT
jgi:ATP-dependent DNA ligase